MVNHLNTIVLSKIQEVARKEIDSPMAIIEQLALQTPQPRSLVKGLLDPIRSGIIAEFKRKSPSKGYINEHAEINDIIFKYEMAQASAVSILTDSIYFGGTIEDLYEARVLCPDIPILRKDFIIDPYQIVETRALGADAILLIATILHKDEIISFSELAHALEMEVILEIHDLSELDKYHDTIDIIGVNNRDLKTFQTNIHNSIDMINYLPHGKICISESGINSPSEANLLLNAGYTGLLIGELFMKEKDPGLAFAAFVQQLYQKI